MLLHQQNVEGGGVAPDRFFMPPTALVIPNEEDAAIRLFFYIHTYSLGMVMSLYISTLLAI